MLFIGDFDLDLLKYQKHNYNNDFLDTMFSHCFIPLINRPTRITSHTATLIDNIFVNNPSDIQQLTNGILFSDIFDHLPIFTVQPYKQLQLNNIKLIRREISPRTRSHFQTAINNCNWDDIYKCNNPNTAYNKFLTKYSTIFNTCYPFKIITNKKAKLITKPWITQGFLNSIKKKVGAI